MIGAEVARPRCLDRGTHARPPPPSLALQEIEALVEQFRLDDDEFPGHGTRVEYSLFCRLLTGSGPYSREAGYASRSGCT